MSACETHALAMSGLTDLESVCSASRLMAWYTCQYFLFSDHVCDMKLTIFDISVRRYLGDVWVFESCKTRGFKHGMAYAMARDD